MAKALPPPKWYKSSGRLSIQQRLPLLICILLLGVVLALGWLSEIGVRKAAMEMGKERLGELTRQLGSLFGQSALSSAVATRQAARDTVIKNYLNGTVRNDSAVMHQLNKLRPDSTWVLVELLDAQKKTLLRSAPPGNTPALNAVQALSAAAPAPDSCKIGKLSQTAGAIYYPIIATASDHGNLSGYLVRWRRQTATSKVLAQFSQLLGTNATLYFGNRDGSLWTDMIGPVAPPPVALQYNTQFYDYSRSGHRVMATAVEIPNTNWALLIEFSQTIMLETSRRFLGWVTTAGVMLIITGSLLAWLMSRNITRPLRQLTAAAASMAAGDYTVSVDVNRQDEIGKLARAFNAMGTQVKSAQDSLEKRVEERTWQLDAVNKELEAFSYSVSHDLRAPLRSISGYSTILKDEYAAVMDPEANRLTDKIVSNARKMGQLIDDLISFSKMASKEINRQPVDMQALAISCIAEVLQPEPPDKFKVKIQPLPVCEGDEALLRQVWLNLISNAVKYSSKQQSPCIEIGIKQLDGLPFYYIRDNGAGFDMKYVHKLFGVFQRLHGADEFEGLGVGLALVKRIINRHNGDIRGEASVGDGACFYFCLPKTFDHAI